MIINTKQKILQFQYPILSNKNIDIYTCPKFTRFTFVNEENKERLNKDLPTKFVFHENGDILIEWVKVEDFVKDQGYIGFFYFKRSYLKANSIYCLHNINKFSYSIYEYMSEIVHQAENYFDINFNKWN